MPIPQTADGDEFRFRAGRPSLDLTSTVLWRHLRPIEQLRQPSDLCRWLAAAGSSVPAVVTDKELLATRALREAVYRLGRAQVRGTPWPPADVSVLNAAATAPDPVPQLTAAGDVRWHAAQPLPAALSTIARDAIELLTGPLANRIRECAADNCAYLFVDTSRPGNRRWCATNRCGNRHHVREHRARQAEAR